MVSLVTGRLGRFSHAYFWIEEGCFASHSRKTVEQGLEGLADALNDLRLGKVSGFRYVVRIADTPGIKE